ncbi:MAG TPA: hypothetical protein VJU61_00310, partial [Polyangiaceae bacterium]|nr:hypothetical protein [Polyangiaceae bacterium]
MDISRRVRSKSWIFLALAAALMTPACASQQTSAEGAQAAQNASEFSFAPRVGLVFRHEMKHLDEFTVPEASFREAQEWRILWEVRIEQQGDNYLYHRRLVELALSVNGEPLLAGNEITAKNAEIVQVMGRYGLALA